ncbi:hypothetical protein HK102_008562, partial [Quaeritorhiza haematococci]
MPDSRLTTKFVKDSDGIMSFNGTSTTTGTRRRGFVDLDEEEVLMSSGGSAPFGNNNASFGGFGGGGDGDKGGAGYWGPSSARKYFGLSPTTPLERGKEVKRDANGFAEGSIFYTPTEEEGQEKEERNEDVGKLTVQDVQMLEQPERPRSRNSIFNTGSSFDSAAREIGGEAREVEGGLEEGKTIVRKKSKNSIFDTTFTRPHKIDTSMAPGASLPTETPSAAQSSTVSTTTTTSASRNSIFDAPQAILKPAIKMSPQELEDLRTGRFNSLASPGTASEPTPISTQTSNAAVAPAVSSSTTTTTTNINTDESNRDSMTVPLSLPTPPPYYNPWTPATTTSSPFSAHGGAPIRRHWVDLEDVEPPPPPQSSSTSRRRSSAQPSPSTTSKVSFTTPDVSSLVGSPSSSSTSAVVGQRRLSEPYKSAINTTTTATTPSSTAPATPTSTTTPSTTSPDTITVTSPTTGTTKRRNLKDLVVITNPAIWDNINLSFLPTRTNYLGQGRFATVYRGQYTITTPPSPSLTPTDPFSSPSPDSTQQDQTETETLTLPRPRKQPKMAAASDFRTCAVKRMHPTSEAQAMGLSELFVLRRISGAHPNIIKLIGAKDETEVDSPSVRSQLRELLTPVTGGSKERGTSVSPTRNSASPTRSSARDAASSSSSSSASSSSTTSTKPPQITIPSRKPTKSKKKQEPAVDPSPRLLILLEYEQNGNMWDWITKHKESVTRRLWIKWAKQLASAVAFIHSVGIVHHDIKPHNIL